MVHPDDSRPRSLRRVALREAGVLLLFVLLTIVMTWPLAFHLDRGITDPGDPFFSAWVIDWGYHATVTASPLFDANIFHPARRALAFSEHTYGITLLFLPLFAAGVAPLTIHNVAILAGFALSGYATYLLARRVTGSTAAATIAGIAFAFAGFRFHHLPHLPYVWTVWIPLMLLGALAYGSRATWPRALLFGLATIMNGLTSITYLVFATPAALLVTLFLGLHGGRLREKRFWIPLATAMLVAAIVLTPFLLPYRELAETYGVERTVQEVLPNGAAWRDWLVPNLQNRNYRALSPQANYSHERTLFPGLVTLLLCASALVLTRREDLVRSRDAEPEGSTPGSHRRRIVLALDVSIVLLAVAAWWGEIAGTARLGPLSYTGSSTALFALAMVLAARLWLSAGGVPLRERIARSRFPAALWGVALWLLVAALGARGLHGFFHSVLFERISAYRGIRMPIRWAILAYVALALFAAVGMLPLLRGRSRAVRGAITLLVAVVMLAELRAAPLRVYLVPLEPRHVYEWIRDTPIGGALLELPITATSEYEYVWRSTVHHKPILNGVSSFIPPSYEHLRSLYEKDPIPLELFDVLEARGCAVVVVHAGALRERDAAIRDWLRRGIEGGRLSYVRRFDAGPRGDWVFSLDRIAGDAPRWRVAESPAILERFLSGDPWIPTTATFALMDQAPLGTRRGPLEVSGWAHAPAGVRQVRLRFAAGSAVFPAQLSERPDVRAVLGWPAPEAIRGFSARVERPRSIDGESDFQIEIVDARGRRTMMPPMFIDWRAAVPARIPWDRGRLAPLLARLGADPADADRVLAGSAAIEDFTGDLAGDPLVETDAEFVDRVLPLLLDGPPSRAMRSRILGLTAAGVPRERVIRSILDSRAFREAYTARGAVTP